jgi:hypothetical protein
MFSVLRIESDARRAGGYISRINELGTGYKAHIDRRGCIVADLARAGSDWSAHIAEVSTALTAVRQVLLGAHKNGDKTIVDIALYPRTEFTPGVLMTVDSHRFPTQVLRKMSDLGVELEITITSMAPD